MQCVDWQTIGLIVLGVCASFTIGFITVAALWRR
jgi:hypothetical protein